MNEETMTIGLGFTIPLNKMLDKLSNENNMKAEIGNITIRFIGKQDKKEIFEIVRDVDE